MNAVDRKLTVAGWLVVTADEVRIEPASFLSYVRRHWVQAALPPLGIIALIVMDATDPGSPLYVVSGLVGVVGILFLFAFVALVVQTQRAAKDAWAFRRDEVARTDRSGTSRHPRDRIAAVRATSTISIARSDGPSHRTTAYSLEVALDDGKVFSLPSLPWRDQSLIVQALAGIGYQVERIERDLTR